MTAVQIDTDEQIESLVAALVESNDQIVALYDLLDVGFASLDGTTSLARILDRGADLLAASLELWSASTDPGVAPVFAEEADLTVSSGSGTRSADGSTPSTRTIDLARPDGLFHCRIKATRAGDPFSTGDAKLLTAVGTVALASGYTAHVHRSEVSNAVMRSDYATASELAALALPRWQVDVEGVETYAHSNPARIAGGDFYQYALVDDDFWFVVGDVAGKGLPSALIMTAVLSAATGVFQDGPRDTGRAMAAIDSMVHGYLDATDRFVTAVVGRYNTADRRLCLTNAGHSPVALLLGERIVEVRPGCPPLGVHLLDPDNAPDQEEFHLGDGDRLVIGSDGLTEQADESGRMFGMDRFIRVACAATGSVREQYGSIATELQRFAGDAPQSDDQTLFILKVDHAEGGT